MSATAHEGLDWSSLAASALPAAPQGDDPSLGPDLVAHLEVQLVSARRLLDVVLTQAGAIRRREVREVVVAAGELQVEMHRRELLERERMVLMQRAGAVLSRSPESIGFTSVRALMDPATAAVAADRTDELTKLLVRIDREHKLNRALMAQELAFLDHLLGMAGGTGGYAAFPARATANGVTGPRIRRNASSVRRRVFDLEA